MAKEIVKEEVAPEQDDATGTPETEKEPKTQTLLDGQDFSGGDDPPGDKTAVDTPDEEGGDKGEGGEPSSDTGDGTAKESLFLKQLRDLGFENVEDEQMGESRLLEAYAYTAQQMAAMQETSRQQEQLAQYGNLYLNQQREQEAARQQTQPAEAEEQSDKWWSPPAIDQSQVEKWREVKLDEGGQPRIDWKDNTPPEVKIAADKYSQYIDKWAEDLVQRPQEVLPKIIEKEFDRLFEARWQEQERTQKLSSFAEQVKQNNSDWIYASDPRTGGPMIDPNTSQPMLSEQGQEIMQLVERVAADGITDPETQWLHAVALYDYAHGRQASDQQVAEQETRGVATTKRREHLERGARGTKNRRGGVAPPEEESQVPPDSTLSPGEQLVKQLQADGADFV